MKISTILKGGPGSGNWGHGGLKGVHGGSMPKVGTPPANAPKYDVNDDMVLFPFAIKNYSAPLGQLFVDSMAVGEEATKKRRQTILDVTEDLHTVFMDADPTINEYEAKQRVSEYLGAWLEGSNSGEISLKLQHAAASMEEFDNYLSLFQKDEFKASGMSIYATPSETDKNFIRNMYNNTQKHLADLGYSPDDTITLYRGYVASEAFTGRWGKFGATRDYQGNAIDSWSMDPKVARMFGAEDHGGYGYVFAMEVPVSRILSTPFTGFGCGSLAEVTVLGNPKRQQLASVFPSSHTDVLFPNMDKLAREHDKLK